MITWDDIGCSYGDHLTVMTRDGKRYRGVLVDYDPDYVGDDGGDSISIRTDAVPSIAFFESEILEMIPDKDM